MRFSIVTPSFRNSEWLKLCVASVADQEVEHEHIVQDSCSEDGTQDWLSKDPRVKAFIEKDRGMYDAVNRGFRRASGDILAYINCDEQYLPGALKRIDAFFQANANVDVVFADTVVIDAVGKYVCDRKAVIPQKAQTLVGGSLSFLTCATFLRKQVITERNLYFNPNLRDVGDGDWALKLIASGARMAVLREFVSAFTETGVNMNLLPNARRESKEFFESAPGWAKLLRPAVIAHFRARRWLSGGYTKMPYQYSVYTKNSLDRRVAFRVDRPTFRWTRAQPATSVATAGNIQPVA